MSANGIKIAWKLHRQPLPEATASGLAKQIVLSNHDGVSMRWLLDLGKYKTIVISVALFLIFDLGVLILNFYISSQIREDAIAVNLAGRQRMLSQRMAKEMFLIEESVRQGSVPADTLDSLMQSRELFESTLAAFEKGGPAKGGDGAAVVLSRVESIEGRTALDRARQLWAPIQARLPAVSDRSADAAAAIAAVLPAYKQANGPMLKEMNNLTTQLERDAQKKANTLRAVQVVGISLATINFFIILFHFVRQLRENDEQLAKAKRETDNILATVDQGLFLIDRNGLIGHQQSKALARIINEDNIAGRRLSDVMSRSIKENTRTLVDDFLGILFNKRVKEKLITDINPLNQVEINIENSDGRIERRFLNFNFKRVSDEGDMDSLLTVVTDVTMQTELSMELERSRSQREQEVDAIVSLLHVPPERLQAFLTTSMDSLDGINALLSEGAGGQQALQALLKEIAKPVHRIKGDAASLKLESFETWAHSFEDDLADLLSRPKLAGNDLLPLTVKLKSIYEQIENVGGLVRRLGGLRGSFDRESAAGNPASEVSSGGAMHLLAQSVAEREGKRVSVMQTGDFEALPAHLREDARSVAVQLIRNAVVHGIESPALRADCGKSSLGAVWLDVSDIGSGFELTVRDDGAGIDFDRIRQRAVDTRILTAEQAKNAEQKTIAALIFMPQFSTADGSTQDAGRGVGLSLAKDLVNRHGGKVMLDTQKGRSTQFRVLFPKTTHLVA
jgi:two-component system, chemotaxis family, sensor kinase CheA